MKLVDVNTILPGKLQPPLGIIMGQSRDVSEFLAERDGAGDISYYMDVFDAEKLRQELGENSGAEIVTLPDLWDVETPLQTLLYPVPRSGERALKIDMVEQAFHVLAPQGTLIVLTPYEKDQLFQSLLKKVFRKVHIPEAGKGTLYWCQRQGDRPRRRHEISFHVQQADGPSLEFVSRPGVFAYGRFDEGSRALTEIMEIDRGDRILDAGCGCGTNGVIAGLRSGDDGRVVFVDSNVRALALAEMNARNNGVANFRTVASASFENIGERDFDVALANPPYFAQHQIAALFIERASTLLRNGGRFYLVTKQPNEIGQIMVDFFSDVDVVFRRGYGVFRAVA